MSLGKKIEELSNKQYGVGGVDRIKKVTVGEFELKKEPHEYKVEERGSTALQRSYRRVSYELYIIIWNKENDKVKICSIRYPDSILDRYLRITKGEKFVVKRALKHEYGCQYLPHELIDDIVEFYYLKKEVEKHPFK